MTSEQHPSNDPKASPPTWSELERGLAMSLPILGEAFLVITARSPRNRFVQFATKSLEGLRAETVSNVYLPPEDRLTEEQVTALLELGWKPSTYVTKTPPQERVKDGSPNFFRYYAWDASRRALSLPALRMARRQKTDPLNEKEARANASPAMKRLEERLLAAIRSFGETLVYTSDDIAVLIEGTRVVAQVIETPRVVRVACQLADDVAVDETLLRRLHEINASWSFARLVLFERTVFASVDLPAAPFSEEHVGVALSVLKAMVREHGAELRARADTRQACGKAPAS